ncbi:MAG: hypothetical protein NC434_04600 [Ruminococcus sp.]|nr:hypothetical protein [Ruminococcus sp.]
MRLYKMELYKLCHKKLLIIGTACIMAIMLFFFAMKVSEEWSCVDGVTYTGYQAVQVNRQITEEFKGVITDEKVEKIVERYGLPKQVIYDYGGFRDANFLTAWVTEYLTDAYLRNWDDYKAPTYVYPLADTQLGEVMRGIGGDILLEYSNGWAVFLDFMQIGLLLGSILTIFGVSAVFAGEGQRKMLPLLFTTPHGKRKDIFAKMAAAFSVSAGIWLGIVALDFILCGVVFGFDGWNCVIGTTKIEFLDPARSITLLKAGDFIVIALLYSLLGALLLCAETICISACFKSSFQAVVGAAICWGAPVLTWLFTVFSRFWLLGMITWLYRYASPIYLQMYQSFYDMYHVRHYVQTIAVVLFVCCMVQAYRKYKRQQDM